MFSSIRASPLFAFKIWYLFYFAAQFTQLYLPLLLSEVMRYSPATIGLLISLRRLVIFFVAPMFTLLCDRTRWHRPLLIATHTCYYLCTYLLIYTRALPLVLPLILVREAFVSGCEPTVDNAAFATIEDTGGTHAGYGRLRMFGSAGWGVASLLASLLVDRVFDGDLVYVLHIQLALGVVVVAVVALGLDLSPALFARQTERKKASGAVLGLILASPRAAFCAVSVLAQGVVYGVLQMTLFIYFKPLGVSTTALGLSVLLSCVSEACVFAFDRALWRRLGGPQAAFNVGLGLSSVALLLYAAIPLTGRPTPFLLAVETLNGGTYALFLTSALAITNELAPPSLTTTAQGTLSAVYSGIGPAIGSGISGWLYEAFGAQALYTALAVIQLAVLAYPFVLGIDVSQDAAQTRGAADAKGALLDEGMPLLAQGAAAKGDATGDAKGDAKGDEAGVGARVAAAEAV